MISFLLDTDHLTLYDHANIVVWRSVARHPPNSVAISAVTVEEYLRGRLGALARHHSGPLQVQAYARLLDSLQLLQQFPALPFDSRCESRYQQLRRLRLRVGSQDLRIAASALEWCVTLVTRNARDFAQVPGLVLEDWSI